MKGFWDSLGIYRAYVSCWLLVKKVFFKKIGYVNIFCLVHEPQRVFFAVQEQHGIFAVFFRCTVQEHPCIFAGFFRYFLTWVLEKLWYVRVFFGSVLATLCTGGQQGIFAGFFRYSFTWSLEKLCFLLAVGEKAENIAMCGSVCQ